MLRRKSSASQDVTPPANVTQVPAVGTQVTMEVLDLANRGDRS